MTITVMPVPLPNFTANPVTQIYNAGGNPVTFTNTTNAGTWTWAWRFDDGGTSAAQDPVHTYTGLGTYNVMLTVSNANCTDSVKHPVTVTPVPPVANFDSILSECAPLYVETNNTSTNITQPGITFTWDFGDGSPVSHVKNPTYTYFSSGTFRITLTVKDAYGNQSIKSQVVNAYASPKAYFEATPMTVYVNDEKVRFFNLSQKVDMNDYYVWEFGDGDTAHVEQPFHKYMEQGVFDVTLHAYSSNGCMDSWTLSPGITVEPAGVLRFASVFTPNLSGEQTPKVGEINGNNIDQFFYPPIREKVEDYKLQIFNRWGTLIFESRDINDPWNGYYHHKLCKQGVYVWFVEGKYANGKPFKQVGDITLLH
jgi:PKD repeat protein